MISGTFTGHFVPSRAPRCVVLAALLLLTACAKQGEGERCDPRNDNQDCESGLRCLTLRSLNRGTEGAVCCRDDNTNSAEVCRKLEFDFDDDEMTTDAETSTDAEMSTDDGATTDAPATDDSATDTSGDATDVASTDPDQTPIVDAGNADGGDASD